MSPPTKKKEDKPNILSLFRSPPNVTKHHEEGRQTEQQPFSVSVSSQHEEEEEDEPNNDQDLSRKRKNSGQDFQITYPLIQELEEAEEPELQLTLSLSFRPTKARRSLSVDQPPELPSPPMYHQSLQALFSETPELETLHQLTPSHPLYVPESSTPTLQPEPLPLTPSHPLYVPPLLPESFTPTLQSEPIPLTSSDHLDMPPLVPKSSTPTPPVYRHEAGTSQRVRRSPALRDGKSDTVPAPFPWATTRRAHVHSLNYLLSKQIVTVTGEVQCKKCQRQYEMAYPLEEKFNEVGCFIASNKDSMHDRAPIVWSNPLFPTCNFCGEENSAKPIISEKKKTINWLFLLLGQLLGCLTLDQLKYFCKHTKNHRTGAKNRVLYLTYLALCKQLDPQGPFDR